MKVEIRMSLMEWIDYGLIVIFFVAAGVLVIMIAGPRHSSEAVSRAEPPVHAGKAAYVTLAVLCLFLLCVGWLASKHSGT
jgi:Na+/H+ antiporter NhaA